MYETLAIRLLYLAIQQIWHGYNCSTGEPQLLHYFKMVFLKIQNAQKRTVFVNLVTNGELHVEYTVNWEIFMWKLFMW